ncbi:hypothetical protein QJS10_CPB22g00788 [Acorus calamus]|uniref:BAH domain-containing protein n=1 Tax=Acorus calamus TaxID=4465 RepID=A0AAV9C0C2_ACOCL|nr:hypothetical protein QJS10_CPB22g00788 [Acorus calamus]
MPHFERTDNELEFFWGKKKEFGGPKKNFHLYESFTYDGDEYSLYDCAYFYKEDAIEPYIGKIIRIYESPDHEKKVQALWFFHPVEIRECLKDNHPLEKEIFLATGEGKGLFNINPLTQRNPQPSEEELKKADYIFYRTFDVGKCIISDKIGDNIAGIGEKESLKIKPDVQRSRPSNGTPVKTSLDHLPNEKLQKQTSEVTRKQKIDRKKWFKQEPWKDKMNTATEEGTLVLLQNLDPSYTSRDVEELISCAFQRRCDARMIQLTTFSCPYSGRAFVIFRSKKDAAEVLKRLEERSLILPNKRILVGSEGLWENPEQKYRFVGHLSLERNSFRMQREEMKNAVSTSHCSQPNTIEYEMAMDWEFLQEKLKVQWKALYKKAKICERPSKLTYLCPCTPGTRAALEWDVGIHPETKSSSSVVHVRVDPPWVSLRKQTGLPPQQGLHVQLKQSDGVRVVHDLIVQLGHSHQNDIRSSRSSKPMGIPCTSVALFCTSLH